MAQAQKRIAKVISSVESLQISILMSHQEYADLQKKPVDGVKIVLPSEADMHQWQIYMDGPKASPYEVGSFALLTHYLGLPTDRSQGGVFVLRLSLPPEYPFKPPTLSFTTKIYHPNVTNDNKGSMCLGMLRADEWKPSSKIDAVLSFAKALLSDPQPDDAVEGGIAREYKDNKKEFIKTAKLWTKQHAKK